MEKYNYFDAVKEDVRTWIENETTEEERNDPDFESNLYDTLFLEDSVTGNGSGSYFFNAWEAEEALCHNLDLLGEALEEFGEDCSFLEKGSEACDVTIRCYILGQVISEVLDEMQ